MNGNKTAMVCALLTGAICIAGLAVALTGGNSISKEELLDIIKRMERDGVVKEGSPLVFELRAIPNNLPVPTAVVFPEGRAKVERADYPVAIYDCRGRGKLAMEQFNEGYDVGHHPYRICPQGYAALFGEFIVIARKRETLDVFADYLE